MIISYILGLYFVALPWITWKWSYDAYEYPKVVLFVITINLIMSVKIFSSVRRGGEKFRIKVIDWVLLIWFGLQMLMWGLNGFSEKTLWGQYYRYQGLVTMLAYIDFYFLASRFGSNKILHGLISLGAIVNGFYILLWGVLFNFFHLPVYTFNGRAAGNFGNPNFAAGYLSIALPYLLVQPKIKRWQKICLVLVFLGALMFTQSRSGILAFLLVNVLYWLRETKQKMAAIIPTLIIGLAALWFLIPRYSPFSNQLTVWGKAATAISQRPFIGYGLERFEVGFKNTLIPNKDFDLYNVRFDKAHNEILEQGVAGGTITMLLYIFLIIIAIKLLRKAEQSPWTEANLLAMVAFLVVSQLNVLNINEYLFFYLIIAAARKVDE